MPPAGRRQHFDFLPEGKKMQRISGGQAGPAASSLRPLSVNSDFCSVTECSLVCADFSGQAGPAANSLRPLSMNSDFCSVTECSLVCADFSGQAGPAANSLRALSVSLDFCSVTTSDGNCHLFSGSARSQCAANGSLVRDCCPITHSGRILIFTFSLFMIHFSLIFAACPGFLGVKKEK